ncbi:GNAT family N-acetyltransferase [Pseudooceanicola sp. C21-150M6]|uniref:GNAT family N-acetyltransferase n=1 Tax=Pseudooceanicola sp. C21-150M6 TaxID=3434355 RepID=UPI003D7FE6A5
MTLPRLTPVHEIPVPVIETERLILRGPKGSDFENFAAFRKDPERTKFIGGPDASDFHVWQAFTRGIGHWMWHGYGFWTLEDRATGQNIGGVGIVHHLGWSEPEIGWNVYLGSEGKGYVAEAARAIRPFAYKTWGIGPLISHIHPENMRSRAVAERLGATVEQEIQLLGEPCLIYRHPDPAGAE